MRPAVEVFAPGDLVSAAARVLADRLPRAGAVVVTGGGTAELVYPELARTRPDWSSLEVFFSDERSVPPDDPASNYGMAKRTLFDAARPRRVHRMEGERDPEEAAALYGEAVGAAGGRFDLAFLGLGDDAHVAALFPGSSSLLETSWCVGVDRPDGMRGVSLTPPALLGAADVVLVVAGSSKSEAVARAVGGDEDVMQCPAAMFRDHASVTFLLDEPAAGLLRGGT